MKNLKRKQRFDDIIRNNKVLGLVFDKNTSFVSKIISMFTSSDYTHVEFLLENNYTYGSKNFVGVGLHRVEDLQDPVKFLFKDKWLEDSKFQTRLKKELIETHQKDYDLSAVLTYPFRKIMNDQDEWYCSEYCYHMCKRAGLNLINVSEKHKIISPKDLTYSFEFNHIII